MSRAIAALLLATTLSATAAAQSPADGPDTPGGASLQQSPTPGPAIPPTPDDEPAPGQPGFVQDLFSPKRSTFLGNLYGLRPLLNARGISLGLQETGEVFANPTGGIHRAVSYNGLTEVSLGIDTARAFGLPGGVFNASAFQIHGRNDSQDNLGTLQTASGIEATRATRLWELWYQQVLVADRLDIKVGQQSLDQEFLGSTYAGLFINTAMGWPLVPSVGLYAGGPAYPLASLGVRLRARPSARVTLLAGVFDDNPPGGPFYDDSQVRGASQSGTRFNTGTGALFIAEAQYSAGDAEHGLPGTYKLGGWYDTGRFPDQRQDDTGRPLADPAGSGNPRLRRHNWSVYGVVDQMVWRPDPDGPRAVGVFARAMGAPGDRNLASFSVNAGVTLKAPLPGRDGDSAGLGFGVAKIGAAAIRADRDANDFGALRPVRGSETFIELTYQAQVTPWWIVQPDLQYVWTPAGGVPNPASPGKRIGNVTAIGVRTNVTF